MILSDNYVKVNNNSECSNKNDSQIKTHQYNIVIDGCNVKLNFSVKSEEILLSDLKRIMLCNIART